MRFQKKMLAALIASLFLSIAAQASEGYKNLFVTITSDNIKKSGMALAIANVVQKAGVETTVLVGAEAVSVVLNKGKMEAFGPTGKNAKEMISALIKKGGNVFLCGMCAKYAEISKADLINGVKIATPSDVGGALLAPATQSLSF